MLLGYDSFLRCFLLIKLKQVIQQVLKIGIFWHNLDYEFNSGNGQ